jgi:hypothetical protein
VTAAQRLLRPDQAAAAVALSQAGSSSERIAEVLAVPLEVVQRSLRQVVERVPTPVAALSPSPPEGSVEAAVGALWPADQPVAEGPAPLPFGGETYGRVLVVGLVLSVRKLPRPASWRAPVFVEDDARWPPAPSPEDRWQVEPVSEGGRWERTALREVVLWDERVLVDEDRRVFCPTCRGLVGVVELGRDLFQGRDDVMGGGLPSHRLGLPPARPVSA